MPSGLLQALQLLLSLSILVIVHEFGHFFFAKLFKTKVEKFYLFFDPWFSLFKIKRGDTEYGVGWIPLGGYVKIAGMVDESMDTAQLAQEPHPWEFRSKPAWQRFLIMFGGVFVNFIFAVIIYISMLYVWGEEYVPTKNAKYGIACDSTAIKAGLQNGDKIISVNGKEIDDFHDILSTIILEEAKTIVVERNGVIQDIQLPDNLVRDLIKNQDPRFITLAVPFMIDAVLSGSPAETAGIKSGDQIIALNDKQMLLFAEYPPYFALNKNKEVKLTVLRNKDTLQIPVNVSDKGVIGVQLPNPKSLFEVKKLDYSLLAAIPAGVTKSYTSVRDYLKQFKLIFSREVEGYKQVGGFISMGKIFPKEFDWQVFWALTALLSIMLAVLNILPIPALDGGHILFLIYEMVTKRAPSERFLIVAQWVGFSLLISLVLFANGNDIIKLFGIKF